MSDTTTGRGYAIRPFVVPEASSVAFERVRAGVFGESGSAEARQRAFKENDRATERRTQTGLVGVLAFYALMTVPSGKGVKIAMGKNRYVGTGMSHRYLARDVKWLCESGFVTIRKGYLDRKTRKGEVTTLFPTAKFADLAKSELRAIDLRQPPEEVIGLSNAKWSEPPASVRESEPVIRRLNQINSAANLSLSEDSRARVLARISRREWIDSRTGKLRKLHGSWDESLVYVRRIFTRSWSEGGRFYGGFWMNMPHEERPFLRINGAPTVEHDFRTLHPRLLFAKEGITDLNIEPYVIPGFDWVSRDIGKVTFARLLNSDFKSATNWRRDDPLHLELRHKSVFGTKDVFRQYVRAMRDHLRPIDQHLGKSYGVSLQNIDSEIALSVMRPFIENGLPIFPIHDSFIAREEDSDFLNSCMENAKSLHFDTMIS